MTLDHTVLLSGTGTGAAAGFVGGLVFAVMSSAFRAAMWTRRTGGKVVNGGSTRTASALLAAHVSAHGPDGARTGVTGQELETLLRSRPDLLSLVMTAGKPGP
ncbi:hypothetical protein [Herbihabitans rhizosphaerae]|uniref:hypothetical protein n=1 Tax=Herbihabitans rhizosphaerae TaxID=1872711 RepID=UPI00102CEA67|nr:hypothetical protein [Herbihabitans rhizosphaerae]